MKGIVFTTDAVFALVITVMSITVLLFFGYYVQTPYSLHYSNAQAIFANLASTSVASIQNSSVIAMGIALQAAGANESWPQFLGGPQRNSSNPVGPLEPILLYTYNPGNTMTTGIVADYGNIYFAANNILYAVNATTNMTAWTINTVTNVVTTPALYSGELFFTNSISLSAVNARSGNIIWATSKVAATLPSNTPLLAYDNKVLYTNGQTVYAYYASNGTSAWSSPTVNPPRALIELGGNPEVGTSTGGVTIDYIYQLAQSGTYAQSFVNTLVTGSTNIAGAVNQIYYGQASSSPYTLNSIYANGTVASGFPLSTISQATGVAVYKNYVVYQTGNVVVSSSPSGTRYWNYFMPASFGAISGSGGLANATPVVTGTTIYTQWPRALVAQNLTTGAINWFALLPTTNRYPYMTLAYGKLYVIVNNDVRVYGSCNAPISATLLAAVATMEWNSQSGCDGALLNNVYPSANYTVFVGNPLPYTAQSASFNGAKGYISAHNSGYLNNSYVGVSFWVNISSYPATGVRLLNYGDNSTCASPVSQCGWFFYLKNSTIQFSVMSGSQTKVSGTPNLKKNKWYMITGVLNGTMVSLYINANTPATQSKTTGISPTSPNINLTIGAGLPTDTRYFTGNIANVQIYSKPYGISQVAQLYREGISGPPLKGQGLIAWYPLAGDANDYAFFNPGFLTGSAKFVTSKYTPPALSDAYEVSKAGSVLPVLNYTTGVGNTIQVGVYSWS